MAYKMFIDIFVEEYLMQQEPHIKPNSTGHLPDHDINLFEEATERPFLRMETTQFYSFIRFRIKK